jgi:hypothetical protein
LRLGVVVVILKLCWGALSSFWGLLLIWLMSRSLPWMNIMIAIPAAAIPLITPLLRWQDLCFNFCRLLADNILFFVIALVFEMISL